MPKPNPERKLIVEASPTHKPRRHNWAPMPCALNLNVQLLPINNATSPVNTVLRIDSATDYTMIPGLVARKAGCEMIQAGLKVNRNTEGEFSADLYAARFVILGLEDEVIESLVAVKSPNSVTTVSKKNLTDKISEMFGWGDKTDDRDKAANDYISTMGSKDIGLISLADLMKQFSISIWSDGHVTRCEITKRSKKVK